MPTRITQVEERGSKAVLLRVEGRLLREDAELLEKVCAELREKEPDSAITLDLADLTFLDSESASVLCRIKREQRALLEGLQIFVQRAVELADRDEAA